jgi:hypothetical protein
MANRTSHRFATGTTRTLAAVIVANVLGVPVDQLNVYCDTETHGTSSPTAEPHCHAAMYNAAVDLRPSLPRTRATPPPHRLNYFYPKTDINPALMRPRTNHC